ncbi:hypothetical protein CAEBREN_14742 [Caenorhabditis brenneri]|uniref:Delta-like protein n=1 Tax=Caenorhabditis brenneri TaxID=135651 RepID=G0MTF7_CAEBE|nr:hypothetical protein CAEBREN_14742 [Caenorhabditis brenneri]
MLLLALLFLVPLINCRVEVRQDFLSTARAHLRYELINNTPDPSRPNTLNFSLYPRAIKSHTIHLNNFDSAFNYSVQILDNFSKTPLGERMYRQVRFLDTTQPWYNDTITTASGITLSVATKISCSPHYFGSKCENYCNGHLAKAARKRCDAMGRLRCDVGWMGPHCGQAVDPRKCSCQNDGICASSLIHNSETSVNKTADHSEQLICECTNGYTGSQCEVPGFSQFQFTAPRPDACSVKDACLNGAQCFPNGPKVFCSCAVGFIGEFCEISLTTTTPTVIITATTSDYYGSIFCVTGIILAIGLLLMCIRYKRATSRQNALTRGQEPEPYPMPETKSMLVDPEAGFDVQKKVFTIEDNVKKIDEEERYTMAPSNFQQNNEYAVIQKTPPPPAICPPPVPVTCVYV